GATVQTVGDILRDVHALAKEKGQAVGRMAFGATSGNKAIFIPVAEGLFRAGEVAVIDTARGAQVNGITQRLVEVGDRVVKQLDDVLAAVGIGAGILERDLVVVGGSHEARRPAGEVLRVAIIN